MTGFQVAGDLALSADGTELLMTSGSKMVEQQIRTGSQIWKGYYRYDETVGLPMLESVLVKGADPRVVTQVFREWLAGISGVTEVTSCVCALDRVARQLTVTFAVKCADGSTLGDEIAFEVS